MATLAQDFAALLESSFALRDELRLLPDKETVVCRCEDVPFGTLARYQSWRDAKLQTRCGMGPCQGRLCGLTVTELIAEARNVPPQEVGYYRIRPPVKPITVAELAALPKTEAAIQAVVRI